MDTDTKPTAEATLPPTIFGVMAEFADVGSLLRAAREVRQRGYTRWESYTPFPVHGLDVAMGARASRLPWIVLGTGLAGMCGGLLLTWWTNSTSFPVPTYARGYPYLVSGKPFFSLPAFIPVVFETTVLLAAFGAVFGMLGLNGLPRLFHPLFRSRRFRRVTNDRFFIVIEADDPKFDRTEVGEWLKSVGATAVEEVAL